MDRYDAYGYPVFPGQLGYWTAEPTKTTRSETRPQQSEMMVPVAVELNRGTRTPNAEQSCGPTCHASLSSNPSKTADAMGG